MAYFPDFKGPSALSKQYMSNVLFINCMEGATRPQSSHLCCLGPLPSSTAAGVRCFIKPRVVGRWRQCKSKEEVYNWETVLEGSLVTFLGTVSRHP